MPIPLERRAKACRPGRPEPDPPCGPEGGGPGGRSMCDPDPDGGGCSMWDPDPHALPGSWPLPEAEPDGPPDNGPDGGPDGPPPPHGGPEGGGWDGRRPPPLGGGGGDSDDASFRRGWAACVGGYGEASVGGCSEACVGGCGEASVGGCSEASAGGSGGASVSGRSAACVGGYGEASVGGCSEACVGGCGVGSSWPEEGGGGVLLNGFSPASTVLEGAECGGPMMSEWAGRTAIARVIAGSVISPSHFHGPADARNRTGGRRRLGFGVFRRPWPYPWRSARFTASSGRRRPRRRAGHGGGTGGGGSGGSAVLPVPTSASGRSAGVTALRTAGTLAPRRAATNARQES